jgi:hypothetical protein
MDVGMDRRMGDRWKMNGWMDDWAIDAWTMEVWMGE